jgi:hypothetical protein
MATRTLGIKFEVAGIKEAKSALNNYKNSLNESLQQNKQAVQQSLNNANKLSVRNSVKGRQQKVAVNYEEKEIVSAYRIAPKKRKNPFKITSEDREQINNASTEGIGRYNLKNNQEAITEGVERGTKQGLKDFEKKLDNLESKNEVNSSQLQAFQKLAESSEYKEVKTNFYGGIGQEAGRQAFVGVQNLIRSFLGLEKLREEFDISEKSIKRLAIAISGINLSKRVLDKFSEIKIDLKEQPKNIKQDSKNLFDKGLDFFLEPIKTIKFGFFEELGANFGGQYAKGLTKVLKSDLDVNFERKGKVGGKTIGYLNNNIFDVISNNFFKLNKSFDNFSKSLDADDFEAKTKSFDRLYKDFISSIVDIPTTVLTGHRKGSVEIEGIEKLKKVLANINPEDLPDLTGKKRLIGTVGGFAAEEGNSGLRMAEEIKKSADDKTEVVGFDNSFTDLKFSVFGNKALWGANLLQKLGQLNLKGHNPDSVKIAAQVIALLEKYPDLETTITGHSAGGFVVEEVQELLDLIKPGHKVKTIATGTPLTKGGLNNQNTIHKIGDGDDIVKTAEKAGEYLGGVKPRTEEELGKIKSHFGEDYLTSESYLKQILGEGFDNNKNRQLKNKRSPFKGKLIELETLYAKYLSTIVEDLEEIRNELDIAPDRLIAKARNLKIKTKGVSDLENLYSSKEYEQIKLNNQTQTAVVVIGGMGGEQGESGISLANQLNKFTNDPTIQFIGAKNPYSDSLTKEQMMSEQAPQLGVKKVFDIFAETHKSGYNPDALPIAAQIAEIIQQNPELKVKILGHSLGGYIAEDVFALLKESGLNIENVEVVGNATPDLPAGIKNKKLKKILGEKDDIFAANTIKEINQKFKNVTGFDLLPDLASPDQNLPNINEHTLLDYLENSPQLQSFLFGKDFKIDELFGLESQINEKKNSAESIKTVTEAVAKNPSLSEEAKIENIAKLRDRYLALLEEIIELSNKAKELGGGRRFYQEGKKAEKELAKMRKASEPKTESLEEIDRAIVNNLNLAELAKQELPRIAANSNLTSEMKLAEAQKLRERYIKILEDIVLLSRKARKLGGNNSEVEDRAVKELNSLGIQLSDDSIEVAKKSVETEQTDSIFPDPWEDNVTDYARAYREYLNKISTELNSDAIESIELIKYDLSRLNPQEKKENSQYLNKIFSERIKQFRTAINNEEIQLASELGANLLKLIPVLESLYDEIIDRSDNKAFKLKIRGYKAYLTNSKNEIIQGQPNQRGRAATGLTQNFDRQLDLSKSGGNVVEGFLEPIIAKLDAVEEAGRQIGERLERGANESLEIESPSKVFKRIGRWVVAGFKEGLTGFDRVASDLEQKGRDVVEDVESGIKEQIEDSFDADNIARAFDISGAEIIKKIGSLLFSASQKNGFDKLINNIANLSGKFIRLILAFKLLKVALDALGLNKLIQGFSNLPEAAIEAATAVEALDRRIVDMSGSAIKGAENLKFIRNEAKRLNLDLTTAKQNYLEILGSSRNTALEGEPAKQIYSAFAATAKAKGLSNEQQSRLLEAVRQIIGKRILSQEEVRQQIGELLGDFEGNLATSLGVSVPTLNLQIQNREITAEDALPKVAQQLLAQNGSVGAADTAQAAVIKLDNSIVRFRENVGFALLPLQKFGNNFLSGFFTWLADRLEQMKSLVQGFFLALFANLLRLEVFGQSIQKLLLGLIKLLWSFKAALAVFVAEMALFAAAWKTWETVFAIWKNAFPESQKNIENLTNGLINLRQALQDAGQAGKKLELPDNPEELLNQEGADAPNWLTKVTGIKKLNFDAIRDILNKQEARQYERIGLEPPEPFYKTYGQKRREDFIGNVGTIRSSVRDTLGESEKLEKIASGIVELDAEIKNIQSQRLELLPGDRVGLEKSLAAERAILEKRNELLKPLSAYQQQLEALIKAIDDEIENYNKLLITKGLTKGDRENLDTLVADKELLKGAKNEIDGTLSGLSKTLSEFDRRLRNANERVAGFVENQERKSTVERTGIIERGIAQGKGDRVIQIELDDLARRDLQNRISYLKGQLAKLEKDLQSPELSEGLKRVTASAREQGLELTGETINRLLEEERDVQEKNALKGLQSVRKIQGDIYNNSEQLAQNLQQNRNTLIDFNRTISDYFFRLTQQIAEAQVEIQRIVNQIAQTSLKNKLKAALSPNSESFANQLISSTQSLLDQIYSYADKVLGQKGARIQFAGQKRSLELELQDFARNVNGASEALIEFEQRLRADGRGLTANSTSALPVPFAAKTKDVANRLGIDPHALMTIMLFESAGTLDPAIRGPIVKGDPNNRGRGLIQFMPATARGLGTSDAALAKMSAIEQLDWVEKYFAQFKGNFGAGKLENLYAAVLAGDPVNVNASDGYTTAREGAKRMMGEFGDKATQLLGDTPSALNPDPSALKVPSIPTFNTTGSLPAPPPEAESLTNKAIELEKQKLDLQDRSIEAEKQGLDVDLNNQFESDRRRVENEIRDRQFGRDDSIYAQLDLISEYDYQTADTEAAKNVRAVNKSFSDRGRELFRQIQFYLDEIAALGEIIASSDESIAQATTEEEKRILLEQKNNASLLLPVYQKNLNQSLQQEQDLIEAARSALDFINKQNDLKKEAETLEKSNLKLSLQAQIAQRRETLETQRQLSVEQEKYRLAQRINELKQKYPAGTELDGLIKAEEENSKVVVEGIDNESLNKEFAYEQQLLDLQSQAKTAKAGFLSQFGLDFGAAKLQEQAAIDAENLRYKQEQARIRFEFAGDPEKLTKLLEASDALHTEKLAEANRQYKNIGETIAGIATSGFQNFFQQIGTSLFDDLGQRNEAILRQELDFSKRLLEIEDQYRDNPAKLAQMKNRIRELNEEKLDKINNEFNLFGRVANFARDALSSVLKEIAGIAAKSAASFILKAIAGSFAAKDGATVPNFADGGTFNPKSRVVPKNLSDLLASGSPSIQTAFKKEGSKGVLGVFTPGEEILPLNGEAQLYQALKTKLGKNPLKSLLTTYDLQATNYLNGGTIESNILSGFDRPNIRFDPTSIGSRSNLSSKPSQIVNASITFNTPNANSFRASEYQLKQDMAETVSRAARRR